MLTDATVGFCLGFCQEYTGLFAQIRWDLFQEKPYLAIHWRRGDQLLTKCKAGEGPYVLSVFYQGNFGWYPVLRQNQKCRELLIFDAVVSLLHEAS